MWKRCLSKSDRDEYFALQSTNLAYQDFTRENLDKILGKKGGVFFIYDGGNFHITLAFKYTYTLGQWRVIQNSPFGAYNIRDSVKITHRKIRQFMDNHDAIDFYGILLDNYQPNKLNQYYNLFPNMTWEMTSDTVNSNGIREWKWHRDPARVGEDELWLT